MFNVAWSNDVAAVVNQPQAVLPNLMQYLWQLYN